MEREQTVKSDFFKPGNLPQLTTGDPKADKKNFTGIGNELWEYFKIRVITCVSIYDHHKLPTRGFLLPRMAPSYREAGGAIVQRPNWPPFSHRPNKQASVFPVFCASDC